MKNLLPILLLMSVGIGCDLSKYVSNGKPDNANVAKPSPEKTPPATPKPEATPSTPAYIALLKKSAGKYPNDIKLLENVEIKDRLKKLLGKDFTDLKAHWNVETPMEIENGVFKAGACEAHNCGSNNYLMFVDLKSDSINVYHIVDGVTRHYFESGEINLPKKFADELSGDQ
ncbi:hypothetical protein BH10ACI2_BH10ACI2_24060 [soil metagenome]